MGCDGGSIPKRDEIVRLKKKDQKVDESEKQRLRWQYCAITEEPLKEPVVCDEVGNLFNKEAVLQRLLSKSMEDSFNHIRGMKDIINLKVTKNPDHKEATEGSELDTFPFICPITGYEANGKHKFTAIRTCGHVFASKALVEVPTKTCLVCTTPFTPEDLIALIMSAEETLQKRVSLLQSKKSVKDKKKDKKEKKEKKKDKENNNNNTTTTDTEKATPLPENMKKRKYSEVETNNNNNNTANHEDIKLTNGARQALSKMGDYHDTYSKSSDVYKSLFKKQKTEK